MGRQQTTGTSQDGTIPDIEFDVPGGKPAALARQYTRNFLDKVIVRLDLAAPLGIGESGPTKGVVDALKKRFPVPEPRKSRMVQVVSTPQGTQRSETVETEWFYHAEERNRRVFIGDLATFIEYDKYSTFDRLKRDFEPIVDALFRDHPNVQVGRLGLRYIDKVEVRDRNKTDWTGYFRPELLAGFRLPADFSVTRAMHLLERRWGDIQYKFRYGMPNPDYPSVVRRKEFVLDTDVFCSRLIDNEEVPELLWKFHCIAKLNFEMAIGEKLRQTMKVKDSGRSRKQNT